MSYNIFISYSTKDLAIVDEIREALNIPDVSVFTARYSISIGERNLPEIERAIDNCDLFIVLWTHNSKESDWVKQEISYAAAKNKWFLPIVTHRGLELPPFIRDVNYFPAYDYPNELYSWLRSSISASAAKKKQNDNVVGLLGLAASIVLIIAAASNDNDEDDDDEDDDDEE